MNANQKRFRVHLVTSVVKNVTAENPFEAAIQAAKEAGDGAKVTDVAVARGRKPGGKQPTKTRKVSAATRRKMSLAQKKRHAAARKAS